MELAKFKLKQNESDDGSGIDSEHDFEDVIAASIEKRAVEPKKTLLIQKQTSAKGKLIRKPPIKTNKYPLHAKYVDPVNLTGLTAKGIRAHSKVVEGTKDSKSSSDNDSDLDTIASYKPVNLEALVLVFLIQLCRK